MLCDRGNLNTLPNKEIVPQFVPNPLTRALMTTELHGPPLRSDNATRYPWGDAAYPTTSITHYQMTVGFSPRFEVAQVTRFECPYEPLATMTI